MLIATMNDKVKDKGEKGRVGTPWMRRSAAKQLKIYCRQVEEAEPFTTAQLQVSERSKRDLSFDTGTHRHDRIVLIHFLYKRKKSIYNAEIWKHTRYIPYQAIEFY